MAGPPATTGMPGRDLAQQLAATVHINGRAVGREVLLGIRDASRRTGVDFTYMLAKANQESGLRPDAANARGTARGLFQFTNQTWLEILRRHAGSYGLDEVADAIRVDGRGRFRVDDPAAETRILDLREDPRLSALMAAEYAGSNKAHLHRALGRPPKTTELYLAHFLGPSGAVTFLEAAARTPHLPAERVLPEAAAANPGLFRAHGRPRTLDEVHRLLHGTITQAMRGFQAVADLAQGPAPRPPGAKPIPPAPEDMGVPLLARAATPLPPGTRPASRGAEDMGGTRLAKGEPPLPPGARPAPATPEAPAPDGETRVAAATPPPPTAPPPTEDMHAAESAIARVLAATQAVEEAGATQGLDLPGPSALAMAALLDEITGSRAPAEAAPVPAPPPAPVPATTPAEPPRTGSAVTWRAARADIPTLAPVARGAFRAVHIAAKTETTTAALRVATPAGADPADRDGVLTGAQAERRIAAILTASRSG
ncbi:hypothetical protein [uncultured Rhodospira sp.]|uniref:hypothetical protein n=1 Tax=uncultured Rhodospira sp. TaxID=1936189 RepID=UPI002613FB1E|nr:hypothetical protein [uncultured Rhodospira sp.]